VTGSPVANRSGVDSAGPPLGGRGAGVRWRALLRRYWLPISFVVLLVTPLYLLLVSVVVRSDLLSGWGAPLTPDQFRALFAFLGVALGVVATTLGALLTKANNDRALAQREESERRMLVEARESNSRQKLDTAIQVLNLIKNEDQYAGKAVTGAAIATLVVLGYPVIAMRTLGAALAEDVVDSASAAWVIDQVLSQNLREVPGADAGPESVPSREAAAVLLFDHVSVLTQQDRPGAYAWPACVEGRWPTGLSLQSGWVLMLALLRLLVSRKASWWTTEDDTWSWVIYTLYCITEDPTSEDILKGEAATYALLLLPALDLDAVNGTADEVISVEDLRARLRRHTRADRIPSNAEMRRRVEAWISEAVAGRPAQ
jgi:hypothetical protein